MSRWHGAQVWARGIFAKNPGVSQRFFASNEFPRQMPFPQVRDLSRKIAGVCRDNSRTETWPFVRMLFRIVTTKRIETTRDAVRLAILAIVVVAAQALAERPAPGALRPFAGALVDLAIALRAEGGEHGHVAGPTPQRLGE